MGTEFDIDHVALHLVDTSLDGPILSKKEIDLNSSKSSADLQILLNFFKDHLKRIWQDRESKKTCAASFKEASEVRDYYAKMKLDSSKFFEFTCEMAKQLFYVSPNTASRGLLMVLMFRVVGDTSVYLGLLKMDPGKKEAVTLSEDEEGNLLLDLAVKTINQVLPEPSEKILKWAIIPHPARNMFDLKVKDEQSGTDRALYFMKFLGCEEKPSAVQQTKVMVDVLKTYASENAPKELDCKSAVNLIVENISKSDATITVDSVIAAVSESKIFDHFDDASLKRKFEDANVPDLCIPSDKLRDTKILYNLSSGILIKGPRDAMENYVRVETKDSGMVIICIETTSDYEIKYV